MTTNTAIAFADRIEAGYDRQNAAQARKVRHARSERRGLRRTGPRRTDRTPAAA